MVQFKSLFGAVVLASSVFALPMPQDSAVGNEVGVAAPNGIPISDTVELASQSAAEAAAKTAGGEAPPYAPAATTAPVYAPAESPAHAPAESPVHPPPEAPPSHETTTVAHPQPTYGSGSAPWNNGQQYNDCVQQCIASHGAPPATWTPTATAGHGGATPTGAAGATHTVIVAPKQGVLRYVPFAVNASIGDVIEFRWGADRHTVTKSDTLKVCNATEDAPFASGVQNNTFVYTQVVNTTEPMFFHCAVGAHCKSGMFGIVNPPNSLGSPMSVAGQMNTMSQADPNVAAMASYTKSKTEGTSAASWGNNINLADMPDWSHKLVMENVMYTRTFLAENPETISENGVSLSSAPNTPLKFPEDISTALNNAGAGAAPEAPAGSEPAAPASESASNTASSQNAEPSNGALSMSPSMTLGLFTAVAAIFLL